MTEARQWNMGTCRSDAKQEVQGESLPESESSEAVHRDGLTSSSTEGAVMALERRGQPGQPESEGTMKHQRIRCKKVKPFEVSKREVYSAWLKVKRNRGSGGVDEQSIEQFAVKLENNLYKLWNRMTSGTYYPRAVRRVEIPKKDGTKRPLGIPTVIDRVAQEVVRARLEEELEAVFLPDSYGFRPNKSAHQAVAVCRQRNFHYDWAIDLDIEKYFDTIDHELLMKAVRKHCKEKWMVLYIERWLKAPIQLPNGEEVVPEAGTPQGGVVSPLLANLFLHYAFDAWMRKHHRKVPYERYADDVIIHCSTLEEAEQLLDEVRIRFAECHLSLHPLKTKIVYCKDSYRRRKSYPDIQYTFLGFLFRPRRMSSKRSQRRLTRFLPGISPEAKKSFRTKIREALNPRNVWLSTAALAERINPIIRGWVNYFAVFSDSHELGQVLHYVTLRLSNWLQRKFRWGRRCIGTWLQRLRQRDSSFFAHWRASHSIGWSGGAV